MTRSRSTAQSRQSRKSAVLTPPSRPKTIAAAVSLAMVSPAVLATWDNQVEAWVRPGTDRSYGGIEGLLPLSQSGTSLTFADLKFKLGQSGSYEGNVGLGHRFLTSGGDWALGFYGAWDHRRSKNDNSFNQVTAGVEARSEMLDFRFNYYWPLTDRKLLGLGDNYVFEDFSIYQSGIWEEAMKGYDIEAGVLLPLSDKWETRAYAAYYNFEGKDIAPKTDGWRVRLEVRPTRNFVIGLSHQQDDMFDNQTSLELRYIFGKEAKPGVRTLKERMTDPWTRDIDIVVSTPQEGNGSRFGERVPGIDVVHVDSARGSDVTGDGSYERPYATTTYCETQKCAEGVTNPAVDVADYNVIRLWEGTSQSDGGYAPINLYNGQMLAGEPVTAAMIVGQFHPGRPGAIDVPWNLDLSNAPVINGNGGPAIALTSGNNRIMGVATVSGGIQSGFIDGYGVFAYGPVSGFVDIRNNDIQAYYPGGVGIGLQNYNSTLDVTIGYNRIGAGDTGILLYNVAADGGSATMTASIYGNDIRVIDLYGAGATGVSLFNVAAVDGAATMYAGVYGNTISAASADGGSAMGLSAVNAAKYASSAAQYVGLTGNSIEAVGGYAMGAGFVNIADGYSTARQFVFAYGNAIGAYGGSSADGVTAINAGKYGDYARQDLILIGNTITASDTIGMDSATGVSLFNRAAYGSSAYQGAQLKYNTIAASSVYGNATGVYAYNAAWAVDGYSSGLAEQNLAILGGSITANAYQDATGVALVNLAETSGGYAYSGGYAHALQTAALYGTTLSAGAYKGDAHGVYAANAGIANLNYSAADGVQTVILSGNVIGATSTYGNAYGVYASNRAAAGGGYSFAASGQSLDLGNDNSVSATAKYAAYGVSARNAANAYGTDSASFAYQGVTIGDGNVISATGKYAVGVAGHSQSNANGDFSAAFASQPLTIGSGNTISATSNKYGSNTYSATGIYLSNTVNASGVASYAQGSQLLIFHGTGNAITASAYGDATGISAVNSVSANGSNAWADGSQAVNISGDWWDGGNVISASSAYYSASGIRMGNSADSNGYASYAYGAQTLGIGSYNSIAATGYDAHGIALNNAAGAWGDYSSAFAGQTLGMGYGNTVSALANGYFGSARALVLDNYATADGSSSIAGAGQYAHLGTFNGFVANATGTYGSATALSADNAAASWGQDATADGSQTIVSGDGNDFIATGISGSIRGIALNNSADAGYYYNTTANAGQTLELGSYTHVSANATGTGGSATALYASNYAQTWNDYALAGATQTITVGAGASFIASATGVYGTATGVSLNNYAYTSWDWPSYATASQSFSLGAGSSITATGANGATGLYASNYAYADGGTAQAMQVVNLNGSAAAPISITATSAYGPAYGLALYNSLNSHDYNSDTSTAVQTVTVGNAGITANGDGWSLAVLADNYAHAHDYTETAVQTVVIGNSTLSSNIGDAVYAINYNDASGGTAVQTLVVTGSAVYGGIDNYASGIQMVNSGSYYGLQTGSIVANYISSFNDGVAIYNAGGDVQIVTVSGNTFNVLGSPTYADGGGNLQVLNYTP